METEAKDQRTAPRVRDRLTAAAIVGLARWTPYVEREICGLRDLVWPGDVCIDVGAAAGLYTAALSALAGPAGKVHSIEPLPFAGMHLARILDVRGAGNVCQHAVALGPEPGVETMNVPLGRFGFVTGRSFVDRWAVGPDPNVEFTGCVAVSVTVDTLDALCVREAVERLSFVKIDVEGYELQVLEGGKQVMDALRPAVLVEIESRHTARYRHTPEDVTSWFFDRGYTMYRWQRGWVPVRSIDSATRNYLFRATNRADAQPARRPQWRPAPASGEPRSRGATRRAPPSWSGDSKGA